MVDFNGFDKGVIGRKLPADTTLNNMRKMDLVKLLHLAEDNHRVLAEAYKIAVDNSKCKVCPLELDKLKGEKIRVDERTKTIKEVISKWCDETCGANRCVDHMDRCEFGEFLMRMKGDNNDN